MGADSELKQRRSGMWRTPLWWAALALSATLPMWSAWLVNRWGGHFAEWVYYGKYRDALSTCFLISAALVVVLLRMPQRCGGLRAIAGLLFLTLCLLAATLPRPSCPEAVFLGRYGVTAEEAKINAEGITAKEAAIAKDTVASVCSD